MTSIKESDKRGAGKPVRHMPSLRKCSRVETERIRRIGVRIFNDDPFAGLKHLQYNGILRQDPAAVGEWLLTQKGLSRSAIGEFLGSPSAISLDVLEHYVSMQKLYRDPFVQAMRRFMSNFRIPGEAQKIERILEVFARHYSTRYPGDDDGTGVDERGEPRTNVVPSNLDTAHILSYSIIMLNTDLHNNNVKHHMSRDEFVRNNRGIDNGKDLPPELLESIYNDVSTDQFKAKEDHLDELHELERKFKHLEPENRLVAPHRQLVSKLAVSMVADWKKSQPMTAHPRTLFLFNDMVILAKKTWGSEFVVRKRVPMAGLEFEEVENDHYPCGFEIKAGLGGTTLIRVTCESVSNLRAFMRQGREMLSEAIVMERLKGGAGGGSTSSSTEKDPSISDNKRSSVSPDMTVSECASPRMTRTTFRADLNWSRSLDLVAGTDSPVRTLRRRLSIADVVQAATGQMRSTLTAMANDGHRNSVDEEYLGHRRSSNTSYITATEMDTEAEATVVVSAPDGSEEPASDEDSKNLLMPDPQSVAMLPNRTPLCRRQRRPAFRARPIAPVAEADELAESPAPGICRALSFESLAVGSFG